MNASVSWTYPIWVVGSMAGETKTEFVSATANGEKFVFVFTTRERAEAFASRSKLSSPSLLPINSDRHFLGLIADLEKAKYTTIFFDHDPNATLFNSSPIGQVKNELAIRLPPSVGD